jgi:hypothetical protein
MEKLQKSFDLTYAELTIVVGNVIIAMERDFAEFTPRGITQVEIDAFKAQGDTFELYPTDDIFQNEIAIVVVEKNNTRNAITLKVRRISGYFEQKWGLKSPYYKQLGIKGMTDMKDDVFLVMARRVVQVATSRLADLSPIGLTQADIDALEADAQTFENKLNGIYEKTAERDVKTNERTALGNALYEQLAKYCAVGKNIWEDVNEAKYNDYVIHKTVHHELPKVQNVQAAQTGPNAARVDWDPVPGAAQYEVDFQSQPSGQPAGEWQERFTVDAPEYEGPLFGGQTNFYRVRAINASQTGAWSDVVSYSG